MQSPLPERERFLVRAVRIELNPVAIKPPGIQLDLQDLLWYFRRQTTVVRVVGDPEDHSIRPDITDSPRRRTLYDIKRAAHQAFHHTSWEMSGAEHQHFADFGSHLRALGQIHIYDTDGPYSALS